MKSILYVEIFFQRAPYKLSSVGACACGGEDDMDDRITKNTTRLTTMRIATKITQNFHPIPFPEDGGGVVSKSITFDPRGAEVSTGAGAAGISGVVRDACNGSYVMFSSGSKISALPAPVAGGLVFWIVPGIGVSVGACVSVFGVGRSWRMEDSSSVDIVYSIDTLKNSLF
jgi:hypothetical protein